MNINELIAALEEQREWVGGETEVRIAYQPSYPLAGSIDNVTSLPINISTRDDDEDFSDDAFVWIAVGVVNHDESPYAPRLAWEEQ